MGENPIRSPQSVLEQQPAKEAALILHLGCPDVFPIVLIPEIAHHKLSGYCIAH
jgi:hypothetical protein